MTLSEFSQLFAVLAIQLGKADADETTIRAYYKALDDLDVELVAMATQQLGKRRINERGETWFPKAPEWRAAVERIELDRQAIQTARIRERLRAGQAPLCGVCDDTGFALNASTNRVAPCDCRKMRRLEILGRRPMPALPEASERC